MSNLEDDDSKSLGYIYSYCKLEKGGGMVCCDAENCLLVNGFITSAQKGSSYVPITIIVQTSQDSNQTLTFHFKIKFCNPVCV